MHDALIVALMRPGNPDRRHLIVAIADAIDTMSLRFAPEGARASGWHDLSVSVPKFPKLSIRARRGYVAGAAH